MTNDIRLVTYDLRLMTFDFKLAMLATPDLSLSTCGFGLLIQWRMVVSDFAASVLYCL